VWHHPSLLEWAPFAQKSWRIERPSTPWCGVGWCSLATATARPKNGKTVRVLFWSCLSVCRSHTNIVTLVCNGSLTPLPLHCLSCALGIVCELQHALLPVSRTCFHGGGEPAPSGPAPVAFAINAHTQSCAISLSLIHSLTRRSLTHSLTLTTALSSLVPFSFLSSRLRLDSLLRQAHCLGQREQGDAVR